MRVLFVTPYIPSPVRVRPYQLIRALASNGHSIHLVALQPPEDEWASAAVLRDVCASVEVFALSRARTLWNTAAAVPTATPLQVAYSHHPAVERYLGRLARRATFDVFHVEHLRGAILARQVMSLPRVFDAVDSIAYLFEQAKRLAPSWRKRLLARADLWRTRRFEAGAPLQFERTIVTSAVDRDELVALAGDASRDTIVVVPNGVDTVYFQCSTEPADPATVLFTGKMSYHANAAAALYLAREVMPLIWGTRAETRLIVAGKDPPADIVALAADRRVEVTGYVEDIRPSFMRATVAVAPMLYSSGIQNKILEAMASGVPVVASPRACRSLYAEPGRHLLTAESAQDFAEQVLRVMADPNLRQSLTAAGRQYVELHHDWAQSGRRLAEVYVEAVAAHRCRAPSR